MIKETIEIFTGQEILAATKYMTAEYSLDKEENTKIGEVYMTKKFNNRLSKEKQKAVKSWLKKNAGREFDVEDGLKIELIFHADKSKVEVTFKLQQAKEQEY